MLVVLMAGGNGCHQKTPPVSPLVGEWKEVSDNPDLLTIRTDGTYSFLGGWTERGSWRTGSNELILHDAKRDAFETSMFLVEGDLLKLWDRKFITSMRERPDANQPDAAARRLERSLAVAELNRRMAGRTYTFIRWRTPSPIGSDGP